MTTSAKRYRLAPGLEIVRLEEGRFLLRSDFAAAQLSGETAIELVDRVLDHLREPLTLEEIAARMPGYRPASLESQLDGLVREGILVAAGLTAPGDSTPFAALFDEIGLGAEETLALLGGSAVAVFGLEAHGGHVARMLADAGVGRLVLVDPFPFEPAHLTLTPVRDPHAVGWNRELAVARLLSRPGLEVVTCGPGVLDRDRISALAAGCQLLVVCWDRGFHAAHHWANEAALEHGVPALFSELRATNSFAGPFYLPNRSACWMCYRMRAVACEEDFDLAMSYEEHLDRKHEPSLASRPVLPGLAEQLASTLALEALKYLIRLNQPTLVDKVLEYDALLSDARTHPVLVKPFCATCSKKNSRRSPARDELLTEPDRPLKPLHELADLLVSNRTGIVVDFAAATRDATEPPRPFVWRARLSNHCFLSERAEAHAFCSGKGMTRAAAWTSCLGEAVERYSGGCWDRSEVLLCRRRELPGRSLDPAELVLYREEQYADLRYARYCEDSTLAWVRGRSLLGGDEVWIPAIGVFMEYQVHGPDEFLFPVTSNGLAAGRSVTAAVLAAIYEVLERDAMLIAWLNRLPGRRLDAPGHPDAEVRELVLSYRRRGVELALYALPTDHPVAVVLGIAFQRGGYGGPFATVGLGADLDLAAAARRAALEVGQVRPAFRERCRTRDAGRIAELVADPSRTKTLEDHALLYADPRMAPAFEFLEGERAGAWPEHRSLEPKEALTRILDHFRSVEQEVLYVNLTPPDLEPLGLHTTRAILPGFQPIWFGRGERRLGGSRLFALPQQLGLRDAPSTVDSLNPLPHPIA